MCPIFLHLPVTLESPRDGACSLEAPSSPGPQREVTWRLELPWLLVAAVPAATSSVCPAPAAGGRCPSLLTSAAFRPGLSGRTAGAPARWGRGGAPAPDRHTATCCWCSGRLPGVVMWAGYVGHFLPLGVAALYGLAGHPGSVALGTVSQELLEEAWGLSWLKKSFPCPKRPLNDKALLLEVPACVRFKPPTGRQTV